MSAENTESLQKELEEVVVEMLNSPKLKEALEKNSLIKEDIVADVKIAQGGQAIRTMCLQVYQVCPIVPRQHLLGMCLHQCGL